MPRFFAAMALSRLDGLDLVRTLRAAALGKVRRDHELDAAGA